MTSEQLSEKLSSRKVRLSRFVDTSDLATAVEATATAKRRVRVYSSVGFVARSYKWPAPIEYIEATKQDDGWDYELGTTDAKRPFGRGKTVVVQ